MTQVILDCFHQQKFKIWQALSDKFLAKVKKCAHILASGHLDFRQCIARDNVFILKGTSVSVCFRGISRLPSAFVFLRWFKLAHISIQVCTFHDGCRWKVHTWSIDLVTHWPITQNLGTCVEIKNRLYQCGLTTGPRVSCSPRPVTRSRSPLENITPPWKNVLDIVCNYWT